MKEMEEIRSIEMLELVSRARVRGLSAKRAPDDAHLEARVLG